MVKNKVWFCDIFPTLHLPEHCVSNTEVTLNIYDPVQWKKISSYSKKETSEEVALLSRYTLKCDVTCFDVTSMRLAF